MRSLHVQHVLKRKDFIRNIYNLPVLPGEVYSIRLGPIMDFWWNFGDLETDLKEKKFEMGYPDFISGREPEEPSEEWVRSIEMKDWEDDEDIMKIVDEGPVDVRIE